MKFIKFIILLGVFNYLNAEILGQITPSIVPEAPILLDSTLKAESNRSNNTAQKKQDSSAAKPESSIFATKGESSQNNVQSIKMGLKDLLKKADENYALQAQLLKIDASKRAVFIARAMFIPRFDVDYGYQYNYKSIPGMTDFGNFGNYQVQNANAKFALDIFSGFSTINQIREQQAKKRSVEAETEYVRQQIYLQVIQNYYSYFNNSAQTTSLKHKLEQMQEDVRRVSRLYDSGLASIDDLESLKSQEANIQYQVFNMELSVKENKLMLGYLTNQKVDNLEFKWEELDSPLQKADNERADIISMEEQIKSLVYANKQLHYFPTVSMNYAYTYMIQKPGYVTNPSDPTMGAFYARMFPTHANVINLSVNLPLLDKIGLSIQRQYNKISRLSQEKQLAYKKAEKDKDLELYKTRLEVSQSQILAAQKSLDSANISFNTTSKKYKNQLVSLTEYLRSVSAKFDAEAIYYQSLNNYELQKANYLFYSGQKIQDHIKEQK